MSGTALYSHQQETNVYKMGEYCREGMQEV